MTFCAFLHTKSLLKMVAKMSCIFRHQGVQLILAFSWARLAILVAGKGRGECFYFFCFFSFIPVPPSFPVPLFHLLYSLFCLFLPFSGRQHKMTHKGWLVVKPQHNQSIWIRSTLKGKTLLPRQFFPFGVGSFSEGSTNNFTVVSPETVSLLSNIFSNQNNIDSYFTRKTYVVGTC